MNPNYISSFFDTGGVLARLLPDFRVRSEQQQMAATITAALEHGTHCLAEAGTGVGKSLAYLVPGLAWALENETRLLVSTHTKALQSQLIEHELPLLAGAAAFSRSFRYEICLGVENYLCLTRLLAEGQAEMLPGLDPEYAGGLREIMHWCLQPVSGLRQDAPSKIPDSLWRQVCVITDLCLGRNCPHREECFLQQARERQRQADVLVTNHSLFFSNLAADHRVLPDFGAAILDEAHRLEDVAGSFLGDEVAHHELQQLLADLSHRGRGRWLRRLKKIAPAKAEELSACARAAAAQLDPWWDRLLRCFPPAVDTLRVPLAGLDGLEAPATETLFALGALAESLRDVLETEQETKDAQFLAGLISGYARRLHAWYEHADPGAVYWAEVTPAARGPRLRVLTTPLDLSGRLRDLVFSAVPTVVLTSATLAVNGSFAYIRSRLGIEQALETVLDSPFPYEDHAALYLPGDVPDPRAGEAFEARVLDEVLRLVRLFGGGLFVLFTNYRFLRRAGEKLRELFPDRLILVQGEEAPHRLLKAFKEHGHAVMLGVETFWQGVNVPGDALRCVVITKLPFDVPSHPVHQARMENLEAGGENPFLTYSIPRAILMLRQGFGRLIRRHEDRGVVAILDPRVRSRAWGHAFLDALPACARLQTPQQVEAFVDKHFSQKKVKSS
jgi:ATP-dependent DNA helicase DinG